MKSAAHQHEDKLLEFAYGELPQHEADAVDAHVRGCKRCSLSLSEIRAVRATMAQLPMAAAPEAGLESLLAYAAQSASRSAKPAPSFFKRFLMPLASLAALVTVGVVGFRANQEFDTSPASAMADQKLEAKKRQSPEADGLVQQGARKESGQESGQEEKRDTRGQAGAAVPAVVAAGSPEVAAVLADDKLELAKERPDQGRDRGPEKNPLDEVSTRREANGKRGDVWGPEPKAAPQSPPQSISRRADPVPRGNDEQVYRDDYSNAIGRGALAKDVTRASPPPPVQDQDKFSYGLGTGADSQEGSSRGSSRGMAEGSAPSPKPAAESVLQPENQPAKKSEDAKKRQKAEAEEGPAEPAPVVAAAPMASSSPQKKSKSGYGIIKPQLGSTSSSMGSESDNAALEATDALGVDRDAQFTERARKESRTQSLEDARVASSRGDRRAEVRLLAQVLEKGATGYERVEALKRICDAYEFLKEPERADPFCDQLLQEFPNTAAARQVSDRRRNVQRAPTVPSATPASAQ